MRTLLFLCFCCAGILVPLAPPAINAQAESRRGQKVVALDWLLDEGLFSMSPDDLEKKAGSKHFVWQDKERTRARFNPDDRTFQIKGVDVGEVLINFKDGTLASAAVSVMNKGDEEEVISEGAFNDAVKSVQKLLGEASGVKEEKRRKDELLSAKSDGAVWRCKKALYIGEWLFLPEKREEIDGWIWTIKAHGEFVRIRIMPPQVQLGVQLSRIRTTVSRPVLATRVKRADKTSAVIEGIPMVDQGSKGYCAVASLERVLRHYGADVDMHDLANAAETYGGTNPQKMKTAITRMAQRLSLRVREIVFLKQKQYEVLFKNYNMLAKKEGKDTVDLEQLRSNGHLDWQKVDPKTLVKFRSSGPDFIAFKKAVVENTSKGIPILWALQLGLFWEEKIDESYEANRYAVNKDKSDADDAGSEIAKRIAEQRKKEMEELRAAGKRPPAYMMGGHMRLIIGYDGSAGRIFYTDSWGPGHEVKSMPLDEAWAATMALWALEPS